jgi:hypothetical protein
VLGGGSEAQEIRRRLSIRGCVYDGNGKLLRCEKWRAAHEEIAFA